VAEHMPHHLNVDAGNTKGLEVSLYHRPPV